MDRLVVVVILIWNSLTSYSQATLQEVSDNDYRAAKYSFKVDFSKAKQAMPELQYMLLLDSTVSYIYYIQYGKDTLIEIMDPGNDIMSFSLWINIVTFSNRKSVSTVFVDEPKVYATSIDTINYSIEESKGIVKDLCDGVGLNTWCDSVTFIAHSTKTEYKMFFNDSITNLRSEKLFYPDIKYLPNKIIRMGRNNNTFNLEEFINGKAAVDSLLYLFSHEGYTQFNDDITPADRKMVLDFIEKLECIDEK